MAPRRAVPLLLGAYDMNHLRLLPPRRARTDFEPQVHSSQLNMTQYRSVKRFLKLANASGAAAAAAPGLGKEARAAIAAREVFMQVSASTEALLRYLLADAPHRSALLMVEGSCWRGLRNTSEAHAAVARYYGVPYLDFAASLRRGLSPVQNGDYYKPLTSAQLNGWDLSVCESCIRSKRLVCAGSPTPIIFSDGKHPDYRGHFYVAETLAAGTAPLHYLCMRSRAVCMWVSPAPRLFCPVVWCGVALAARTIDSFLCSHSSICCAIFESSCAHGHKPHSVCRLGGRPHALQYQARRWWRY